MDKKIKSSIKDLERQHVPSEREISNLDKDIKKKESMMERLLNKLLPKRKKLKV